jgi:hypothetical protein
MPVDGTGSVTGTVVTRPANTTAYASGDLVANSVTAGSVVPITFAGVQRSRGVGATILRARVHKSDVSVTTCTLRLHLYTASPTVANGDNGVMSSNKMASYIGTFEVIVDKAFSDGAAGVGLPLIGTAVRVNQAASATLYGLLEARSSYTPASAETFTCILEVQRD